MTPVTVNKTATIIILVAAALALVTLLQSCDSDYFGRPPDAYSTLK
jgi:hypothetical protein